jgi:hypothetical protein
MLAELSGAGSNNREMAVDLNRRGVPSPSGARGMRSRLGGPFCVRRSVVTRKRPASVERLPLWVIAVGLFR